MNIQKLIITFYILEIKQRNHPLSKDHEQNKNKKEDNGKEIM